MRIITTLPLLLLSSPVFAETWVCAHQTADGSVYQDTYTRSGDHFVHRDSSGNNPLEETIGYEDEFVLVLHHTRVWNFGVDDERTTFVSQINKSTGDLVVAILYSERGRSAILDTQCTAAE